MVMGSDNGGQGRSRGRSSKQQLRSGQLSAVGGGLVVGIATFVVVGAAGKLFSKLRKPKDFANDNTPSITPTDSLDIHEENSDSQIRVAGEMRPTNKILINEQRCSASDLENAVSDHNDPTTDSVEVNSLDRTLDVSAHSALDTELSPRIITGSKLCPDQLDSDDDGFFRDEHSKEGEDSSTASETALSKLLNHALLDAKHESSSEHELLSNSKALQDGIVGVITRAFEDFNYGDTSSDELTPTKVKLTISWETNSFSGSEKEVVHVHKEPSLAENELSLPGSIGTEAEENAIERIKHDAEVSEDEKVAYKRCHPSSSPIEEQVSASGNDLSQEEEWLCTTDLEGKKIDRGEPLQTAGSYAESTESTNPEEVPVVQQDEVYGKVPVLQQDEIDEEVPVLQQDRTDKEVPILQQHKIDEEVPLIQQGTIKCQSSTEVLQLEVIQEVLALVDEAKVENTFQEYNHSPKLVEEAKILVEVISNLLRSNDTSPNEATQSQDEDSIQIAPHIAEEDTSRIGTKKESPSQECDDVQKNTDCTAKAEACETVTLNLLKSTESSPIEILLTNDKDLVQISTRKADVVADAALINTAAGGLKWAVKESRPGNWLWVEVLGLIVALIAILVWAISAREHFSVPSLH